MNAEATVWRGVCVVLFSSCVSLPAMAQGVGAIGGTVSDASGAILPGVTVTLSNPGTIGGNREAVTDERGGYQFARLVPGRYSVKAALTGFQPTVLEDIIVNADATARADLKLEVGALQEGIIVKGEAPLLDTSSALNQTVMSRDVIDVLPGRNDLWNIARMVPAILPNKYDVGGTESYQQSIMSIHGSVFAENAYLIDGMHTGWPGSEGSVTYYYDPFMFQEINYQTANGSAERSMGGVIYNMIPRTGTNVLRGGFTFSGASHGMSSSNVSPELRQQLLAGVPARALAANPNLQPGADLKEIHDTAFFLSGPVLPNKLWWVMTGKYSELTQLRVGSYDPSGQQTPDDNRIRDGSTKFSWQAMPNSQLHFLYDYNNKQQFHRSGNATTDFADSFATWRQSNYWSLYQTKWTMTLSSRMVLDTAESLLIGKETLPQQPEVKPGAIPKFDNVTRNHTDAFEYYQINPGYRNVFQTSLSYVTAGHDLKLGYQFMRVRFKPETWSMSHYPSGLRAIYRNGVPDSVNTYNTPVAYRQFYNNHAVYLQDKWRPIQKLTLSLGVRFESLYGWQPEGCQPETVFIGGQCFGAIEGVPDWKMVLPRIAAIYDVFGTGRTAVKAAVNQYYMPQGVSHTNRINPIRLTNDTRPWTDRNGDLIPQLDELGPSTGFNLGTTNRYAEDLAWPYSYEINAELEQQLPWDIAVSVGYYHREQRDQIGSKNLAVPAESYAPLQVTEVTSGRQVTVYNQNPATRGRFDVLWDNYPELNSSFNGVDVSITKRMSRRWMLIGGLSVGRSWGDIYGTSDLNNPNFTFRRGLAGQDVPMSWKLSGAYELPYGVSLSASAQHFTGAPENTTVNVGANTVGLTQVSQALVVEPRGTTRVDSMNQLDLGIRKSVTAGRIKFEPTVDFYNVFNSAAVVSRTTLLGPTYGRVANIQRGRLIRAGVRVNF